VQQNARLLPFAIFETRGKIGIRAENSSMAELPRDQTGWRKLVRRIARATRNTDEAEDLLHAAFLRLAEYRRDHRVENPSAFVVRTAVNMKADEARHRRVRNEAPLDVADLADISDNMPLQTEVLAARERLRRAEEGLSRLSPRTREIFLMHRIDGLKYREIAERLGITVSAVEKHVAKAALFLASWVEGW
jgi:RNA polymerase sigma factor (sigma-70 family)